MDFEPGDREEALRHFSDLVVASRCESGCLDYVFSPDPDVPGRVRVFEHWDSDASLTTHLTLPHVAKLGKALAPLTRIGRSLTHSTVAVSRQMGSASAPAASWPTEMFCHRPWTSLATDWSSCAERKDPRGGPERGLRTASSDARK
ncbi:putative quinol monooxygenase [Aeromicrobium sp.]|uniref:putative quinol monooxygenase n=1 Tax=Aeromicrobium sp. TaxID=1871063 RepID=UPI0034591CCC